ERHLLRHRSAPGELDDAVEADSGLIERLAQCILIELRMPSGARKLAHIDDELDVCRLQQCDELLDRSNGMSHGEERLRHGATLGPSAPEANPVVSDPRFG